MKPQPPCKDCVVRHAYCHGNCDLYQDFLRANELYKAEKLRQDHLDGKIKQFERKRGR